MQNLSYESKNAKVRDLLKIKASRKALYDYFQTVCGNEL